MKITWKRAGALALASTVIASSFGTATSGAIAQDQTDLTEVTQDLTETEEPQNAAEPQVRFVANEMVQDVPVEPEVQSADASSLRELVGTIDTAGEMSREVMCLAQAVYFESRGEPLNGQLAVARVIVNRAESNRFPDDYCSVVTQRSQFSFVRGGHIPMPNESSSAWNRAKAIARIAHRDLWDSEAGDALYFHATHVRPSWARRMTTRARIDNHIFYR